MHSYIWFLDHLRCVFNAYMNAYMNVFMTGIHTRIHTYINTYTNTYMNYYTQTWMHTCIGKTTSDLLIHSSYLRFNAYMQCHAGPAVPESWLSERQGSCRKKTWHRRIIPWKRRRKSRRACQEEAEDCTQGRPPRQTEQTVLLVL
jgi:hypothetical protein